MALHVSTVTGTTDSVAGTRSTFQHGLTDANGGPLTPDWVGVSAIAADADGAITPAEVQVVSYDDTDVVVRAEVVDLGVEIVAVGIVSALGE